MITFHCHLQDRAATQTLGTTQRRSRAPATERMFIFFCPYETDGVITYAAAIAASSSPAQPSAAGFRVGNLQWQRQARLWIGDETAGWPRASPQAFCLSRCFAEAQGTSLGDERIYLSVTELAERVKRIWLETGWGGAGGTFRHLCCTRVRRQSYRALGSSKAIM